MVLYIYYKGYVYFILPQWSRIPVNDKCPLLSLSGSVQVLLIIHSVFVPQLSRIAVNDTDPLLSLSGPL